MPRRRRLCWDRQCLALFVHVLLLLFTLHGPFSTDTVSLALAAAVPTVVNAEGFLHPHSWQGVSATVESTLTKGSARKSAPGQSRVSSTSSSNQRSLNRRNRDEGSIITHRRREVVQDIIQDSDGYEPLAGMSSVDNFQPRGRAIPHHEFPTATTLCDSDSPQTLGPGWNGTFASNSPEGMYPSQNRTCVWTIHAASSSSRDSPYVIQVNFSTPIQLICGTDYLTLYDGPDTTSPRIAVICGQIWPDKSPTFYSTGQHLTAVFTSQERSPGSFGFTAVWTSVAPCSVCSGRGTCTNGNTCACHSGYSGVACESVTTEFKDFVARSQHAMAYDAAKDMVYIMGGTSLKDSIFWDMLSYQFGTNKWSKIDAGPKRPSPRYGHFAFVHNSDVYVYGGVSSTGGANDLWRFNVTSRIWDSLQAINQEKLPEGRAGSACVVVTNNNSTKLYVFGGLNSKGQISRDLNYYDIGQAMWRKSDHQNSVGLAGATAVYHKATDSIYYFGGMVNPTTRNVLTYQYRISQDLWYALAPRVDPFTTQPTRYWSSSQLEPSSPLNSTDDDAQPEIGHDSDADVSQNSTAQYLPPVMYDQVTAVWSPAALMGDDLVVMYGGMRPFGPGLNERDQSCFVKGFSIFDLSCQTWKTYETPELAAMARGRANHTMIIRPSGAAGGNQTTWTAYIFGGFDGVDHADVVNVTLNIPATTPEAVNNCRALRWCSLYDDCPNCNLSYCSYVNGLCLFDTDKAKGSAQLVGTAMDVPKTGTVQDLLRQRPELQKVQSIEGCPEREPLVLGNPFARTLDPDKEKSFIIYIDAHDLNIRFEVRTYPSMMLSFKTLNVWEGFMNMYWRADHGLTDGTWDGDSWTSSPNPSDIVSPWGNGVSVGDSPVISPAGFLNTSELMNRWTKYSGLDASLGTSAIRRNTSYIYFPANDPRRFSGYYVFSLTNHNPTPISYSLTVTLMDHPTPVDKAKSTPFNMATLAFFMLGFVLAIALLVFMARKIRQLVEDRDAAHRAAEMQMLEEDEEQRNRNGRGNGGGMNSNGVDGDMLLKRPMYRVVIGVQDVGRNAMGIPNSQLRQRIVRADGPVLKPNQESGMMVGVSQFRDKDAATRSSANDGDPSQLKEGAAGVDSSEPRPRHSRVRSDYIRDIGSAPLILPDSLNAMTDSDGSELNRSFSMGDSRQSTSSVRDHESGAVGGARSRSSAQSMSRPVGERNQPDVGKTKKSATATPAQDGGNGLHRGWSLKSLGRSASLKRLQSHSSRISPEERKGLTSLDVPEENESTHSRNSSRCYDSEQEIVDLSRLTAQTDLLQARQEELERYRRQAEEEEEAAAALNFRRRNPIKVQPISVEPLPFQAGLVPRTMAHLKRYQRNLAKQQQQREELQRQQSEQSRNDGLRSSTSIHDGAGAIPQGEGSVRRGGDHSVGSVRSTRSARRRPALGHSSSSSSTAAGQRTPLRQVRAVRSQGSLHELQKKASRMTLRTNGEAVFKAAVEPQSQTEPWRDGTEDLEAGIELRQLVGSRSIGDRQQRQPQQQPQQSQEREVRSEQPPESALGDAPVKRKPIKMRGRQEYEPGPLLAMNILIVFPGDAGSRRVRQQGDAWKADATTDGAVMEKAEEQRMQLAMKASDDTLYNTEKRLPPMAIGTVFVPDPVRWWAYKAKQQLDRRRFERQMRRRMLKHEQKQQQQQQQSLQRPSPAKTR